MNEILVTQFFLLEEYIFQENQAVLRIYNQCVIIRSPAETLAFPKGIFSGIVLRTKNYPGFTGMSICSPLNTY
jgi:hypothetical protein